MRHPEFAVSIRAAGAAVPWHILLLAYGSGVGEQNPDGLTLPSPTR
jgi:hypothetical protein